jgi:hypothetical protein
MLRLKKVPNIAIQRRFTSGVIVDKAPLLPLGYRAGHFHHLIGFCDNHPRFEKKDRITSSITTETRRCTLIGTGVAWISTGVAWLVPALPVGTGVRSWYRRSVTQIKMLIDHGSDRG